MPLTDFFKSKLLSINIHKLKAVMEEVDIPGISIAAFSKDGKIATQALGVIDRGVDLHILLAIPESLEGYKQSYILVGTQLYFIKQDGSAKKILFTDFNTFSEQLALIRKNNTSDKIDLSRQQVNELITCNTGHIPFPVKSKTLFGVASLSKPIFAYLVLKLIEDNKPGKTPKFFRFKKPFDLKTPLVTILNNERLNECTNFEELNAWNVLSHQTGLPIKDEDEVNKKAPFKFTFEPGSGKYGYSNVAINYLQEVIQELTGLPLHVLAKTVVFDELGMADSAFLLDTETSKSYAACDLQTTPTDYASFMFNWWRDEEVNYAFNPVVKMTEDDWAIQLGVQPDDLEHVAWGLGIALQLDKEGKAIRAFHSGDMNSWRAWVAMNLENSTGVVYCANSPHGHILADQVISPNVELTHAFNFFFTKFGFARNNQDGWQAEQTARFELIGQYEASLKQANGVSSSCLKR